MDSCFFNDDFRNKVYKAAIKKMARTKRFEDRMKIRQLLVHLDVSIMIMSSEGKGRWNGIRPTEHNVELIHDCSATLVELALIAGVRRRDILSAIW